MALHGHTILELTDVHTGKTEVVEKDNIITGAVQEIFTPLGLYTDGQKLLDNSSFVPITELYGGLLLYDTALGADPATVFAPATAQITGSGVYNVQNTTANIVRGSYNQTESEMDLAHGMAKFVYDFSTAQGNGVVASVCLSSRLGGYYGEGEGISSNAQSFANTIFSTGYFLNWVNANAKLDRGNARLLELDEEQDEILTARLTIAANDLTVTMERYPAHLRGTDLFWERGGTKPAPNSTQVITIPLPAGTKPQYYWNCNFDAERRTFYFVVKENSGYLSAGQAFTVYGIQVDTAQVTTYPMTNQTGKTLDGTNYYENLYCYAYDGRFYTGYSASGSIHYFSIKLSDPGDVRAVENFIDVYNVVDAHDGIIYLCKGYSGSSMDVRWYTLNTATMQSKRIETGYYNDENRVVPVKGRKAVCLYCQGEYLYAGQTAYMAWRRNYLGTINDLEAPVEKTADKTMKITYILRRGE